MKIFRFALKIPPALGGMENHILELTKHQINTGHKVNLFYNSGDAQGDNFIKIIKFPLYKLKPQFIGVLFFYSSLLIRFLKTRDTADIIHLHGDWSSLVFLYPLKRLTKAKAVFTIHDEISENNIYKFLMRMFLRNVDIILVTGYQINSQLKKICDKKVIVQPSGINDLFFKENQNKYKSTKQIRVLTVARFVEKKNIDYVLEIASYRPKLKFTIVGGGPEKERLINLIELKKLSNVEIKNERSKEELYDIYHQHDIFLLTSIKEGTPTVLFEAMACGLPFVYSNAGKVNKYITSKNIFLSQTSSINEYLDSIDRLSKDDKLRHKISSQNKKEAKNYSWPIIAKKINQLYEI